MAQERAARRAAAAIMQWPEAQKTQDADDVLHHSATRPSSYGAGAVQHRGVVVGTRTYLDARGWWADGLSGCFSAPSGGEDPFSDGHHADGPAQAAHKRRTTVRGWSIYLARGFYRL